MDRVLMPTFCLVPIVIHVSYSTPLQLCLSYICINKDNLHQNMFVKRIQFGSVNQFPLWTLRWEQENLFTLKLLYLVKDWQKKVKLLNYSYCLGEKSSSLFFDEAFHVKTAFHANVLQWRWPISSILDIAFTAIYGFVNNHKRHKR